MELNQIYHGDSLELMRDIPDGSIDMILCDPPQGITRNGWDVRRPLGRMWEKYYRVIKDNGAIVIFSNGMLTAELMMSNPKMWRYNLIWEKTQATGFLNANRMPLRAHEDICVFYKRPPLYNPQKTTGHVRKVSTEQHQKSTKNSSNYGHMKNWTYDSTERFPRSVLKFPTDKQTCSLHPTQKPVALCEWLIRAYTNEGDTVLDDCAGSGTTGVACLNAGRDYILMENDREIYETARERIENHKRAAS